MTDNHNHTTTFARHWPTILLGLIVAIIFFLVIFSFQVQTTQVALVTTFGEISEGSVRGPGFHMRWPYPIQAVYKFDNRLRCFDGNVGKIEEAYTKDGKNLIVSVYVIYKIKDPVTFFKSVVTINEAEDLLNDLMRTEKDSVIGQYDFDQIVNVDPQKMRIKEIEEKIKTGVAGRAEREYGLLIQSVGIKQIGLPEKITDKVFERMKSERSVVATNYRSEGKKIADNIRNEADKNQKLTLADAEAKAKRIRAEGDAEAASYYAAFRKDPELAAFLRKLDSLKKIMGTKTTLILDTESAPFDLLRMNSSEIQATGKAAVGPTNAKTQP